MSVDLHQESFMYEKMCVHSGKSRCYSMVWKPGFHLDGGYLYIYFGYVEVSNNGEN